MYPTDGFEYEVQILVSKSEIEEVLGLCCFNCAFAFNWDPDGTGEVRLAVSQRLAEVCRRSGLKPTSCAATSGDIAERTHALMSVIAPSEVPYVLQLAIDAVFTESLSRFGKTLSAGGALSHSGGLS